MKFGARLRRERERKHISIDTVAAATKIKASLFEQLERGDTSRWPAGIFFDPTSGHMPMPSAWIRTRPFENFSQRFLSRPLVRTRGLASRSHSSTELRLHLGRWGDSARAVACALLRWGGARRGGPLCISPRRNLVGAAGDCNVRVLRRRNNFHGGDARHVVPGWRRWSPRALTTCHNPVIGDDGVASAIPDGAGAKPQPVPGIVRCDTSSFLGKISTLMIFVVVSA